MHICAAIRHVLLLDQNDLADLLAYYVGGMVDTALSARREMSFRGHDSFADNAALAPAEDSVHNDGGDDGEDVVSGDHTGDELANHDEDADLPQPPPESSNPTDNGQAHADGGVEQQVSADAVAAAKAAAATDEV